MYEILYYNLILKFRQSCQRKKTRDALSKRREDLEIQIFPPPLSRQQCLVSSLQALLVSVFGKLLQIQFVDLNPDLVSSILDLIIFFSQSVSFEGMSMILCSSDAACKFFILIFCFLFYGPSHWTEDVNNAYGFQSRREWFGPFGCGSFCLCLENGFLCPRKEFVLADLFYKLKIGLRQRMFDVID